MFVMMVGPPKDAALTSPPDVFHVTVLAPPALLTAMIWNIEAGLVGSVPARYSWRLLNPSPSASSACKRWIKWIQVILLLPAVGNSVADLTLGRIEERLGRQLDQIGVGGTATINRVHPEKVRNRAVASRIQRNEYR